MTFQVYWIDKQELLWGFQFKCSRAFEFWVEPADGAIRHGLSSREKFENIPIQLCSIRWGGKKLACGKSKSKNRSANCLSDSVHNTSKSTKTLLDEQQNFSRDWQESKREAHRMRKEKEIKAQPNLIDNLINTPYLLVWFEMVQLVALLLPKKFQKEERHCSLARAWTHSTGFHQFLHASIFSSLK